LEKVNYLQLTHGGSSKCRKKWRQLLCRLWDAPVSISLLHWPAANRKHKHGKTPFRNLAKPPKAQRIPVHDARYLAS
jgi:hypothetical protein